MQSSNVDNKIENKDYDSKEECIIKASSRNKLYALLQDAAKNGDDSVVSWHPDGKSFQIHKQKELAADLIPKYFDQIKYRSFQRQLHTYGFRLMKNEKVSVQRGAYFHELFIRGKEDLCLQITRQKGKGVQQEDTSDRFHNSGVESIKLSSCLRKISELMGAKEARELRITKPKKEVSITQSLYMRAKEENAGSESEVADDEVLQMKRRIDLMLACYQTKEAPTKIPTLTHHDNVREREGGETTFAGKRFHDVECNIMGNNSSVVAQAPTSADHVWSFGQVVQMAPRGDIVMKAGMKNPAA